MKVDPSKASVDAGTVRERFNFDWATSDPIADVDTYWWWARSIRVDPNEVIADDGEGGLWSVPFSTDGVDGITFGEPVRVAEQFAPIAARAAGEGAAAMDFVRKRGQKVIASALERPGKTPRASTSTTPGGSTMNNRSRSQPSPAATAEQDRVLVSRTLIAEALGLPVTATAAEITATVVRMRASAESASLAPIATRPPARSSVDGRGVPISNLVVRARRQGLSDRATEAQVSEAETRARQSSSNAARATATRPLSVQEQRATRLGLPATASLKHIQQARAAVEAGNPVPAPVLAEARAEAARLAARAASVPLVPIAAPREPEAPREGGLHRALMASSSYSSQFRSTLGEVQPRPEVQVVVMPAVTRKG